MQNFKHTCLILMILFASPVLAQLNPMSNQFFHNQYMSNPAMAGVLAGIQFDGAFKAQWTNISGAPVMQSFTASYGSDDNKVGAGINFYNEKAGIIKRTSVKGSYAYHLPVSNGGDSYLDFGISVGVMKEFIDVSEVQGDNDDISFYDFNARALSLDGDFGAAFRTGGLTVQAALPNLKRMLKRDNVRAVADRELYMTAASYRINIDDMSSVEPKVAYRGVENFSDIYDLGVNLEFISHKILLSSVYHSTKNVTVGFGMRYNQRLSIIGNYTSNSKALGSYTNGEFEIGVKLAFLRSNNLLQD